MIQTIALIISLIGIGMMVFSILGLLYLRKKEKEEHEKEIRELKQEMGY